MATAKKKSYYKPKGKKTTAVLTPTPEWNDAFVLYLKNQGIEGIDDDQIVQKWVALLLMQVNDSMENPADKDSKFE